MKPPQLEWSPIYGVVAMIFDDQTGNAIDAFDYTAEELRRRADELDGRPVVTMEPNPNARLG